MCIRDRTTTLQLMEEHELADHIVIREFAARLAESCSNEVFALERRAALMLGQEEDTISGDENPLGPPHLCGALSAAGEALASIRGKPALRPILLRRLEQYLHTSLPDIYHQVNDLLIKRGVLPEIKRATQRKPFVPRIHKKSAAVQAK